MYAITKKSSAMRGFTIVELLIVIVVIGVLAAITIVSYNGIQTRSRDTIRISDLKSIAKAVELYKVANGTYPLSVSGSGQWAGNCPLFGSKTSYIAGIQEYMPNQPLDPRWPNGNVNMCYLYRSDGTDFAALAWNSMETICGGDASAACNTPQIKAMDRPPYTEPGSAVVYTGVANYW